MVMPERNCYLQTGTFSSSSGSTTPVLPAETTISSRSGNAPVVYQASNSIELVDGFESGKGDEFTAYTTTDNGTGSSNGGIVSSGGYRYGFNGKENDEEVKGTANQQDYGMRIYDPRLGRFLSVDPLANTYPWYTPYSFAGNKPIWAIDLDGAEEVTTTI